MFEGIVLLPLRVMTVVDPLCLSVYQLFYRVSATLENPENLLKLELPPGNLGNLLDSNGYFLKFFLYGCQKLLGFRIFMFSDLIGICM